jgi:hypothetical protein
MSSTHSKFFKEGGLSSTRPPVTVRFKEHGFEVLPRRRRISDDFLRKTTVAGGLRSIVVHDAGS